MVCVCIDLCKWTLHTRRVTLKCVNWESKAEKFQVSENSGFKGDPKRDDVNGIKLGHVLKAHVTHFSMWSDQLARLVVILVLQSLILSKATHDSNNCVSNRPCICYIMGVCKNCICSKKMQLMCFEELSASPERKCLSAFEYCSWKKKKFPPAMNLAFCWGKNTCFTKELNIKWCFPVFSTCFFTELFSCKRTDFVLCLTVIFYTAFDFWVYKCKYACKMFTNIYKWRTFHFCFKNRCLLSVGTMQVLYLQSLCKQCRGLRDVWCLRNNKCEGTCPSNGHHRDVRTLFTSPDCLGLLGSTSLWAFWPGFQIPFSYLFFIKPDLDEEKCFLWVRKDRKHVVFPPFLTRICGSGLCSVEEGRKWEGNYPRAATTQRWYFAMVVFILWHQRWQGLFLPLTA